MTAHRAPSIQGATRAPAHVPVSAARASPSADTAAAAAAAAAAQQDALSVLLVTAGYDHTIRFWEAWSGICSRTIQHPDSQVNRLAISPDKRWLAAAGMGKVRLYDCNITAPSQLPGGAGHGADGSGAPGGAAGQAGLGAGGNAGTGGGAGAAGGLPPAPAPAGPGNTNGSQAIPGHSGGQPVATFDGHSGNVTSLAWHADAKWLATGSEDGTLKIWDLRTTSRAQRWYDHHAAVNDVVVHPNQGDVISCDQAGSVKVWDLGQNGCSHDLVPEEDVPIRSVSVASEGSCLVAGNHHGNVYVWRINSGVVPDQQGAGGQGSLQAAPEGSTAADGQPLVPPPPANANPGEEYTDLQPVTTFRAHEKYLTKCLLSPDVRYLATCSADTTIKIWNTSRYAFTLEKTLVGHQRWVWDAAFSADSAYLVSASSDHVARLWELSSGETVRQYNGHNKALVTVALNDAHWVP
ncbi:WD40 repeat-like protein [Tilletiaria anomala UBC 951]|uniref:Target of rapamycin complex subunit LST8 n=1 Tax=Tilletiaria anomala (strain ATCC 24038 / CBS 436.72 / UBC 951) TaxID=1037660 RepID=A0A066VZN7_TILAU|nr:WD40 repeat-like protein [Tilletiaria anomala UBC 951]KDN45753.1 WD40 repeat-like protein [Tilletiaria anomala UBC 951]